MSSLPSGLTAGVLPLTRLGEAWRNRQGLLTLLGTYVTMVVLAGLGVASGSGGLAALMMLVAYAVLLLGSAAAGLQFMDQAVGRPVTPTLAALTGSPMVVLRLIGLAILLVLVAVAWFIVAALVLFVCKLPVIGGLLLAVALPVLTFSGALVFAGVYVALCLAAPALFEGHSLRRALSQLWAVAVQRPVEALLNLFLVFFVVGFAMALVAGFVASGFFSTLGLAAGIVGNPLGGMMMGGMGGMGPAVGGFTLFGGMVGAGIVWAVVLALFGALALFGVCLAYLKLTDGLDVAQAEAALESAVAKTREKARQAAEEARRRTQEMQEAARQRSEQARQRQDAAAAAPADPVMPPPQAAPVQAPPSAAPAAVAATVIQPSVATPPPVEPPDMPPPVAPPVAGPVAPPSFEQTIIMPVTTEPSPFPPAPVIDPTVPDWRCPACAAPVTPDDIFCGACGHKLKVK